MTTYPSGPKEWLAKLVSFDTTSTKSNMNLVNYVRDYLESQGLKVDLIFDKAEPKANIFCTLPGANGRTTGGIILNGHTDVVSVIGQKWNTDPWTLTERDGKLYGRGASDMKGFIAVTLSLVPTFLSMKRAKPIHIAFSYDEELGCRGILSLIQHIKEKNVKADVCLVGDGRHCFRTGNKGTLLWRCTVKGKAIHSSMALMGTSCNAIEYAAQIIAQIRHIAEEVRETDIRDPDYRCPFSSMSVNRIDGGNAVNTVPAECTFAFSIRFVRTELGHAVDARIRKYINEVVVPEMRKEYPEAAVDLIADDICPAFNARESDTWTKLARRVMKTNDVIKGDGSTECGYFHEGLGVPTVLIGAGTYGAHEANEYTSVENLMNSHRVTLQLAKYAAESEKPLESHL